MEHAEALERLADAASEPAVLLRIERDGSPELAPLRAHLRGCAECRLELEAWQLTAEALRAASGDTMRAPADARERILSSVAATGVPRGSRPDAADGAAVEPARGSQRATVVPFRRLALAAAAAVVIFVGGALLGGPLGLTSRDDREKTAITAVVRASDRILQQADHREARLLTPDGSAGGVVLIDPASGEIVVTSAALDSAQHAEYHCYLARDGAPETWIGPMRTADGTSYWAGKITAYQDPGRPGDVLLIRDGEGAPELTATF
ncbi:MAG: hypothetical protein QOH61_952 [Chloroflexota bacterium]|jgi:hypothetical protein|nr:hypothetical protein [Chloroflexota bacterium]